MSTIPLNSVIAMLRRAAAFDKLQPGQQAALRAQVTRTRAMTTDAQVLAVLDQIQEVIGVAEPRAVAGLTADDLAAEFVSFAHYDPRRRAAYKSRLTKVRGKAADDGDDDEVAKLDDLIAAVTATEEDEARAEIRRLAAALTKAS